MLLRSFAQNALENPVSDPAEVLETLPAVDAQGWQLPDEYLSTEMSGTYMPGRAALADWNDMPQHTAQLLNRISRVDMAFRSLQESYNSHDTLLYIGLEDPEDVLNQRDPQTQAGTCQPSSRGNDHMR